MINEVKKNQLILNAIKVKKTAYVPYSKFKVGAALLTKSGKIYVGSNFENAAFGAGVCAERVALGSALSEGERNFEAICICGNSFDIVPCGICRQALSEFDDIDIISCDENKNILEYKLSDIFPQAFNFGNLKYNGNF